MRIVLSMIIAWLFIAATYWFMPNGKRRFQDQLLGAALVAVAWFVLSEVFSVYVNHVNKFTAFYGTLGDFALLDVLLLLHPACRRLCELLL